MKSCLSLLIALVIVVAFIGTALLLWYGSSTTEFGPGPFKPKAETISPATPTPPAPQTPPPTPASPPAP